MSSHPKRRGLKPFFSYYGSKWRAARLYPGPKYPTIIEPFAGGAGYSLRYFDRKIKLFDANPIVVGVWDYLIHAKASEILALKDIGPGQTVDDLGDVPQEAKWLFGFIVSHAVEAPRRSPTKFAVHGLRNKKIVIASQLEFIRHWEVKCCEYFSIENEQVTWFIDPPYNNQAGRHYPKQVDDYAVLARWCMSREGQIIVCENEGADWLPFKTLASIRAQPKPGDTNRLSHEVIWCK